MASEKVVEKHRVFQQYKEDVKERGKPFYPYAMLHDTIMSLVVVSVIAGLAIVWRYTTPGNHHSIDPGWLGRLYDAPADPGTINFVPRPDWYFYFLFYLLRIFKWPETVVIGTVGLPTVLLIILIALPFIDVRQERRLLRRPVAIVAAILVVISMGVLTYKGATAKEPLASENLALVPKWAAIEGYTGNAQAIAGAKLFAVAGCMNCHTYNGAGASYPGAPVLTAEGAKNKGIAFQIKHLQNPSSVNPGSPMPSFAGLGDARLKQIATFLEASKGPKK
jgi:quinol-cytochrome oxidoreductase complex cytochrome b subunit